MVKLTVEGHGTFDVAQGKRLVLALEEDAGLEPLHTCGGMASCSTCRVRFVSGEPRQMTVAEKTRLELQNFTSVRLSCQILCEHDMTVMAISRFMGTGLQGNKPTPELRPLPVEWISI
ncbi:MAG: 2Fe-2S iron-sulfur cluster-binding protein [Pirellulaceae bacterium]